MRLLRLERHNSLQWLKLSNDETLGALCFQTKYTEDDHVRSITTGVNPTDCHVVDFLNSRYNSLSSDETSRDHLHGFLSTAAIMALHVCVKKCDPAPDSVFLQT